MAAQAICYGGYFLLRYQDYIFEQEDNDWQSMFNTVCKAAYDTGSMFLMSTEVTWFSQVTHQIGVQAQQRGWSRRTASMFSFFGNASPYAVYASQRGIAETTSGITAEAVTQNMVEKICSSDFRLK